MVRLCQRSGVSCGACCGLYNRAELSRPAVEEALERSTRALARAERTPAAFREAVRSLEAAAGEPVYDSVRICPLLGFVDTETRRIGCLGHPAVTGGPDLRACGAYDVTTCEAFLCPSHGVLSEEEAELVERTTAGDFYLYGLVISDPPFLRAALGAVAARLGEQVLARHLEHPPFRTALAGLFALKESLEPGSDGLYGAFHPVRGEAGDGDGRAEARRPDAAALVAALGADARSGNDEEALELEAGRRLEGCARAFPRAVSAGPD